MSIFNIFSKRQRKLRGEVPDVYVYNEIPQPLKIQIIYIWEDAFGKAEDYADRYYGRVGQNPVVQCYRFIVEALRREYGVFRLPGTQDDDSLNYFKELANFLLLEKSTEKVLDAVEFSFKIVDQVARKDGYLGRPNAFQIADDAVEELNARFREHGVGFQFVDGQIIRIDSELIHAEVVKPALTLLRGKGLTGAQQEFLKAHEHYRHGNGKEALAECLKAFESVMKVICAKRKWAHAPQATSSALIQVCFDNGLIPPFWQSHFSALRSLLEGGIPTARNRLGGHGQGVKVVDVPGYMVSYVLHMTAASIVFLVEAERQL